VCVRLSLALSKGTNSLVSPSAHLCVRLSLALSKGTNSQVSPSAHRCVRLSLALSKGTDRSGALFLSPEDGNGSSLRKVVFSSYLVLHPVASITNNLRGIVNRNSIFF
jgi:hypothetical protein